MAPLENRSGTDITTPGHQTVPNEPPPGYLLRFFGKSSPKFSRPAASGPASKLSKGYQWFDLHLHEDLRLKHIEILPDFVNRLDQHLEKTVYRNNAVYQAASDSDSTTLPDFIRPDSTALNPFANHKHSEHSVAAAVQDQTIAECAVVASTLLFDLPNWTSVLGCSSRAYNVQQPVAKADAFIFVDLEQNGVAGLLSADKRVNVDLLTQYGLQNFLLYEFKNLDAGDLESMNYILAQKGSFPYVTCGGYDKCMNFKHTINGHLAVTGHEVGPDARYASLFNPGSVTVPNKDANVLSSTIESPKNGQGKSQPGRRLLSMPLAAESLTDPNLDTNVYDRMSVDQAAMVHGRKGEAEILKTKMANRVKGDTHISSRVRAQSGEPQTSVERAKRKDDDHIKQTGKARNIIQQASSPLAWAELVYNDATFIVLSSGNYEIIGMRHRQSQTLYLSPILHASQDSTPHRGIITSLIMIAYYDAIDRALQLREMPDEQTNLPSPYSLSFTSDALLQKDVDDSPAKMTPLEINKGLIAELKNAESIECDIPKIYLQGNSSGEYYQFRECEPYKEWLHMFGPLPKRQPTDKPRPTLRLTADQTDRLQASGNRAIPTTRSSKIVYYTLSRINERGESVEFYSGNLIVKFSVGTEASNKELDAEYDIYKKIGRTEAKDSIPQVFSLLRVDGSNVRGILMACGGMSLNFWIHKPIRMRQRVIVKNRAKIKEALKSFHDAGWIHNRCELDHIIISHEGTTTLVGLRNAEEYVEDHEPMSQSAFRNVKDTPESEKGLLEGWLNFEA